MGSQEIPLDSRSDGDNIYCARGMFQVPLDTLLHFILTAPPQESRVINPTSQRRKLRVRKATGITQGSTELEKRRSGNTYRNTIGDLGIGVLENTVVRNCILSLSQ